MATRIGIANLLLRLGLRTGKDRKPGRFWRKLGIPFIFVFEGSEGDRVGIGTVIFFSTVCPGNIPNWTGVLVIFGVTPLSSVAETCAALCVQVALRIQFRGVPTFGVIVPVPNRPDFMAVGASGCGRFRLAAKLLCRVRDVFFCRGFF